MEKTVKTFIPDGYESTLSLYDTQKAISFIKINFETLLSKSLNLKRVSAPLFVSSLSGLNDNLNNVERPVSFDVPSLKQNAEVIHSLAKWKRKALHLYMFHPYNGLYTDMNAIRRDEELDNIHSIYVDQWDWEKVILNNDRNLDYLKEQVRNICLSIWETSKLVNRKFKLKIDLTKDVYFITSQELLNKYPNLSSKEREYEITKQYKTVCILQIGSLLSNGVPHDNRAPDYDDWQLNCDILYWHETLNIAMEISSMGIRVNKESMIEQLKISNLESRLSLPFHHEVVCEVLPLSIGGGIGQSRLSMLLLGKAHIGEVQVSLWDDETKETTKEKIVLL